MLFFGFSLSFLSTLTYAQSVVQLAPKKDHAAVYEKPDFDSKIILLLPQDKKVFGTKSTVEGLQGLGLFHKVKLKDNVYGFMLDTEVEVLNAKTVEKKSPKIKEEKKKIALSDSAKVSPNNLEVTDDEIAKDPAKYSLYPDRFKGQKKADAKKGPLIFSRLVGAQLGLINYTEKIGSTKRGSQELFYGLKLTGTNLLVQNFWLDISLNFHLGAPQFFDTFATKASGFVLLLDTTMPFILSRSKFHYMYGGLGPLINVAFFDFVLSGNEKSSEKIRLGGVGTLGLAYDISNDWSFKLEGKYYFVGSSYWGVLAGLQKRF